MRALRDRDSSVRANAAEALGNIGQVAKAGVPLLIKGLRDQDGFVAEAAASALGKIAPNARAAVPRHLKEIFDEAWAENESNLRNLGGGRLLPTVA
jgi:HEAT repeat protein